MKIIEIKTTQNVVLQYELADLRERILAYLIDLAILFFGLMFIMGIIATSLTPLTLTIVAILLSLVFIFYSLAFEVFNHGQSPGKMAMRIRVIKVTSGQPTFADYAARWVFRLVDIYFSMGGIASILIASSSKSQRIGDIAANTTVVKLTAAMNLSLKDILTIHAENTYTAHYVQAKQLMEEEVLLIKSALDRYRHYRNQAHFEALNILADRIAEVLNIENPSRNNQVFLQTILKDYVRLTR